MYICPIKDCIDKETCLSSKEHDKTAACNLETAQCPKCEPVKKQTIAKKRKWGSVCPLGCGLSSQNCDVMEECYLGQNRKEKFTLCTFEADK
jgi:hypothetical protein